MSRKRAAVAGAFAIIYPGLGHVYLREWLRAGLWFAGAVSLAALVVPASVLEAFDASGLVGLVEASRELPLDAVLALVALRFLIVVDAIRIGLQPRRHDDGDVDGKPEPTCPHCGGKLDNDLEFCPWCSTMLLSGSGS